MRIVATLTVMPDRYQKLEATLFSLHKQTLKPDAIYLSLPVRSRRLQIPYPQLPSSITNLCTIVSCEDYGPMTKILGALLKEQDPDTIIITFDDDIIYDPRAVEALVAHSEKYPDSAIGSSGMLLRYSCPFCAIVPNENYFSFRITKFPVPKEGRKVDSIYGYPGALYRRKFFPSLENLEFDFLKYALIDNDTYLNDDITISGYLSLQKIERRIFHGMPEISHVVNKEGVRERNVNEISYDLTRFFRRLNAAIDSCKKLGMYSEPEQLGSTETIVGVILTFCIAIVLVILLLIYIFYH